MTFDEYFTKLQQTKPKVVINVINDMKCAELLHLGTRCSPVRDEM